MNMKTMGLYLKMLLQLQVARVILAVFKWSYTRPWTGIPDIVKLQVNQNASARLRYWLKSNGIVHCERCLGTRKQLRKCVADGQQCYLCPMCYDAGVAAGVVREGVDIIKPGLKIV